MPRTKLIDLEEKRQTACKVLTNKMIVNKAGKNKVDYEEIAVRLHCTARTIRNRLNKPDNFKLSDLWALVTALDLTDEEIIQIARGKVKIKEDVAHKEICEIMRGLINELKKGQFENQEAREELN